MDKSVKNEILEMLKSLMMDSHGKRLKPAAVTVEVISPAKKGMDLDDVLDQAAEDAPEVDEDELDEDESECSHKTDNEEEDEEPKKKSFRDFFNR
jgi:Ran GTPase-activating protein (RanGAP) involved in mRNA processing and transport